MSDNTDQDATVHMIPTIGGGRSAGRASPLQAATAATPSMPVDLNQLSGINKLISLANPILLGIPPLREIANHPNPSGLRDAQLQQLREFEANARAQQVSPENTMLMRYVLCTFIDETVAATPWGWSPDMARHSLLVTLHQEVSGGEKFFQLLNHLVQDPVRNIELLEFFHVCLSLGFAGRFRVADNGKMQLENIRSDLFNIIRRQRGEPERDLSKQWRGELARGQQDNGALKLWVGCGIAAFILLLAFVFFLFKLNSNADALPLSSIAFPKPTRPVPVAEKPVALRLVQYLKEDIASGRVSVRQDAMGEVVLIQGDGLFDSGKIEVKPAYHIVIQRIAAAVNQVKGDVVVIGHTDNVASRSLQFPSNWHLSEGRAMSVAEMIRPLLTDKRTVSAEGRGDLEPVAANDTPANKALNRRVEILVKTSY